MSSSAFLNQPWFLGAPATKLTAILSGVVFVFLSSHSSQDALTLDTALLLTQQQPLYQLLLYPLTFASAGELALGTILLVQLGRRFEREMGSRKYLLFQLILGGLAAVGLCVVGALGRHLRVTGPYPSLGALLYLYHVYTPRLHPRFFGILGLHVSEKAFFYLLALQVLVYRGLDTVLPALVGMIAGWVALKLTSVVDVPDRVADALAVWGGRFSGEAPPSLWAPRVVLPRGGGGLHRAPAAAAPPRPVFQPPPPPPQGAIDQLTSMGFEREAVLRALEQSHNNVERAADRLLSGN